MEGGIERKRGGSERKKRGREGKKERELRREGGRRKRMEVTFSQ